MVPRLYRPISRKLEARPDKIATSNTPEPAVYARALAKLHEDALVPAVLAKSQETHPHLYDRLVAAGVTPDYPRPAPADAMAWPGYLCSGALGIFVAIFVIRLLEKSPQ